MKNCFTIQVPKTPELQQAIDRSAAKVNSLLFAFEPELVQMHGRLVRHSGREGVSCKLDLWLPTGSMAAEEVGDAAQVALRAATDELISQIKRHKQKLRAVPMRQRGTLATAPAGRPATPVNRENGELGLYFGAHYNDLLGFIRRQIQIHERLGDLRPGQLDAREVLDEVVVAALDRDPEAVHTAAGEPPERGEASLPVHRGRKLEAGQSDPRGRWFYLLAADAMRRLTRQNDARRLGGRTTSLEANLATAHPAAEVDYDPQAAAEEPGGLRFSDSVPARGTATPEAVAYTEETLNQLERSLRSLPDSQRSDLVLNLLEGFLPEELASLTQRPLPEVRESLHEAREKLRRQPDLPAIWQMRLETAAGS